MRHFTFLFIALLLISSCKSSTETKVVLPDEYHNPQKLIPLLVDVQLMESLLSTHRNFRNNEDQEILFQEILDKHAYSKAQLDTVISFYENNVELYKTLLDSVKVRMQKLDTVNLPLLLPKDSVYNPEKPRN